jgi:glycosyltransferase involved in cell wall biosynthesis
VPVQFTVITPCFNAQAWIGATMASVLAQSVFADGRATLQYLVVDGASADATVAEAENAAAGHGGVDILSEPDEGMYDALAKGLARADGDICCYINAGDLYHPGAFAVVAAIFEARLARWLTGFHAVANVAGEVTDVRLPWRYRRAFFDCGLYGTVLPVVQQESTFWASDLNNSLNLNWLRRCRLAGDAYLWRSFAGREDLRIAAALLGVFRKVPGQLSADADGYRAELRSLCRPPTVPERLLARHDAVRFRWLRTGRRRDRTHIVYDHRAGRWA